MGRGGFFGEMMVEGERFCGCDMCGEDIYAGEDCFKIDTMVVCGDCMKWGRMQAGAEDEMYI